MMGASDWRPTLSAVNELSTRLEQTGLLTGAIESGFLMRCREKTTAAELARATGLGPDLVDNVCEALRSIGVLSSDEGGQVVISDLYAPLLDGGLDRRALDRLTAASVRATMFRELFNGKPSSYWSIDTTSRLALAANATGDPETEFGREGMLATVRADPDWHEAFASGARFLDLGCGIAGAIVSFLHTYPQLTAVGIDIADDVLEVARTRARALGVADRATFHNADATSYRDPDPFDVVFWPQTFYPEPSRADALATVYANLRPGGLLVTPIAPPPPDTDHPTDGRALEPLLRAMWGIRERSFEQVRTELAGAGFVEITAAAPLPPVLPLIKAHRPA
ncbi:SAM-dependent methyltransferase [Nocardia sp. NPDC051052]|uniref:SAM-dependent methyltransferase n=1 Tax=Nocardia sp. NPDC051052 TaxID=3364322 RepID=UPI003789C086